MKLRMGRASRLIATVFVLTTVMAGPTVAHHARSGYDLSKTVTLKGIITRVEWTNPHALLFFDVTNSSGHVQNWHAITGGPSRLSRFGWTGDTLKVGDIVTITGNPTKEGTSEIWLDRITLPGGREVVMHR
jgi:hypothetical protein